MKNPPAGLFEAAAYARRGQDTYSKEFCSTEAGDHFGALYVLKDHYRVVWFFDPDPTPRRRAQFKVVSETNYPYGDLFAGTRAWEAYQQTLRAAAALVALEVFDLPAPLPSKETKHV